jgi:hypothetical protein
MMESLMSCRPGICRLVATLVLLLAGMELLACDLIAPRTCELQTASDHSGDSGEVSGDDCLCCCSHVVPARTFRLAAMEGVAPADICGPSGRFFLIETRIYHPPRA